MPRIGTAQRKERNLPSVEGMTILLCVVEESDGYEARDN